MADNIKHAFDTVFSELLEPYVSQRLEASKRPYIDCILMFALHIIQQSVDHKLKIFFEEELSYTNQRTHKQLYGKADYLVGYSLKGIVFGEISYVRVEYSTLNLDDDDAPPADCLLVVVEAKRRLESTRKKFETQLIAEIGSIFNRRLEENKRCVTIHGILSDGGTWVMYKMTPERKIYRTVGTTMADRYLVLRWVVYMFRCAVNSTPSASQGGSVESLADQFQEKATL